MNTKIKSFLLSILTFSFIFYSCSNLANDLQKRKNQNLFNITIQETSNGTVTAAKSSGIKAGEEVILTVTATSGYELKTITVVNANNKDIAVAAVEQGASYKFTMPDSDVTVGAVFENAGPMDITEPGDLNEANGNTLYRIEHYKQDMDDVSTYTLCAIQKKVGDAGSDTAAIPQTFTGYEVVDFAQKKIAGDGSTVVEIYYNRKTITYTFNLHGGNWEGSEGTVEVSGLYGARVNKPVRVGYTLTCSRSIPLTFGFANDSFNTTWVANTDTPYKIRIYYQEITGGENYYLYDVLHMNGTTDTNTNYEAAELNGFTLQQYEQKNIDGDGGCVLNIYYDRISYTITYELNGGSGLQSEELLYGQSPTQIPVKDGYTFKDWYYDSKYNSVFDNTIAQNITLYACWLENSLTYQFTDTIIRLPAGTDGTAGPDAEYVLFGDYPQSCSYYEFPQPTIDTTKMVKMGNLTAFYGNNGHLYVLKGSHFYKVEPIKWRIISKDENGKAVLFAENALEKRKIAENDFDGNYQNSFIHSFLNHEFLANAFYLPSRNKIVEIEIDNRWNWYYTEESYPFDFSIKTRVYLLSEHELINTLNFTWNSYNKNCSGYAASQIGSLYSCEWVLRNFMVYSDGVTIMEIIDDKSGYNWPMVTSNSYIVPAITVYLPDED